MISRTIQSIHFKYHLKKVEAVPRSPPLHPLPPPHSSTDDEKYKRNQYFENMKTPETSGEGFLPPEWEWQLRHHQQACRSLQQSQKRLTGASPPQRLERQRACQRSPTPSRFHYQLKSVKLTSILGIRLPSNFREEIVFRVFESIFFQFIDKQSSVATPASPSHHQRPPRQSTLCRPLLPLTCTVRSVPVDDGAYGDGAGATTVQERARHAERVHGGHK